MGLITLCGCDHQNPTTVINPNQETKVEKPELSPTIQEEIALLVRAAFYDKPRIVEIICEEIYEPGTLDANDVAKAIDREFVKWSAEKNTWPNVTDCDQIDTAFAAIEKRGIIALQNAGITQSDGLDDFNEAYARNPNKASIVGYCFYHGQDMDRAIHGSGLYLAFGPVDPNEETTKGPVVGKIIREELERVGFVVEWDETFAKRIFIPKFVWQRR